MVSTDNAQVRLIRITTSSWLKKYRVLLNTIPLWKNQVVII